MGEDLKVRVSPMCSSSLRFDCFAFKFKWTLCCVWGASLRRSPTNNRLQWDGTKGAGAVPLRPNTVTAAHLKRLSGAQGATQPNKPSHAFSFLRRLNHKDGEKKRCRQSSEEPQRHPLCSRGADEQHQGRKVKLSDKTHRKSFRK